MILQVIEALISYPILLSFIGPFLFGGETILILSILAGHGFISSLTVLIFCTLGIWTADLMWFLIGKIRHFSKLKKLKLIHRSYLRAKEEIELAPNNWFLLVLIKFAYGIGIPILMYLGRKKMTFREFIFKNTLITLCWSFLIVVIGWSIGKTSQIAFSAFKNIYLAILLIVTGIIIVHLIIRQIRRRIVFKVESRKR